MKESGMTAWTEAIACAECAITKLETRNKAKRNLTVCRTQLAVSSADLCLGEPCIVAMLE